jgi:hypothetical protein
MKYLFLLYGPDGPMPEPGTAEYRQMLEAYGTATQAMAEGADRLCAVAAGLRDDHHSDPWG